MVVVVKMTMIMWLLETRVLRIFFWFFTTGWTTGTVNCGWPHTSRQKNCTDVWQLCKKNIRQIEVDFLAKKCSNICISNDPRTLKIAKVSCQNPMSKRKKNPRKLETWRDNWNGTFSMILDSKKKWKLSHSEGIFKYLSSWWSLKNDFH